jgi:hypothetical protein
MESREGPYHMNNLFSEGTMHHAAEVGSVKAIEQVEKQQKALRGLPAQVVLEERDELLQCVPLHVAAERGHLDVVKVRTTAGRSPCNWQLAMHRRACVHPYFDHMCLRNYWLNDCLTDAGLV